MIPDQRNRSTPAPPDSPDSPDSGGSPVARTSPPPARCARLATSACLALALAAAPALSQPAPPTAQPPVATDRTRDLDELIRHSVTGLALPNVAIEADLKLAARRATAWQDDQKDYVLLENHVRISIGAYGFAAERAVVVLTPHPLPARSARNVAIYLDDVTQLDGHGPVSQNADRLLVTAVLIGDVNLTTDLMRAQPAPNHPFVTAARQRIQRYRAALAQNTINVPPGDPLLSPDALAERARRAARIETRQSPDLPPTITTGPGDTQPTQPPPEPPQVTQTQQQTTPPPPQGPAAQVDFHADRVVYQKGEEEGYVLLLGDVQVMYVEPESGRRLTLQADKAVIFTDPNAFSQPGAGSAAAGDIRGIYLEDNVIATDGQYTLRGPRVSYDLAADKAVVLDAVFYTWDVQRQVPLYVRADQLRQHSASQWSARGARLTTSEFAEPHFSIGTEDLTIEAQELPDGSTTYDYSADGVTLNAGDIPVFYWPSIAGTAMQTPLRSLNVGVSSRRGAVVETRWDLFALLNREHPPGLNAALLVDGYSERGGGVGVDADYDVSNAFGSLEAYYLYDDNQDEPGGRREVDPPSNHRGRVLWRHRHQLPDDWEATAEAAWVSDPTFLEEWFSADAHATKEYETLLYLKQQRDDWAFSFLAKYDLIDFIPQTDRLQTRGNILAPGQPNAGYTTQKLPELAYYRIGTPLWEDRLTWYSENRASVLRLSLPQGSPEDHGFNRARSIALFGIRENTSFETALQQKGLSDDTRYRLDSRQEIQAPMKLGIFNVTPYVVGRVTAYDDGFEDFSGNDDNTRLWAAAGLRAGTSFSRAWDQVESSLLDVHRLRHIIEPSVHVFFAASSIDQQDLPVYDYDVESLADGATVRFGVRNTLQTQRGGPGRWRSVDWIRLDTQLVLTEDDAVRESPIARFFDYRPEFSLYGDHLYNELAWQVTDTLAFVGNTNYSFETSDLERINLGLALDHTPRLSTFVNYRDIQAVESSILRYGVSYLLTPKYHATAAQTFDLEQGKSRALSLTVTRRMPRWLLIVGINYDIIEDIASFGIALAPEGFGGSTSVAQNPFFRH